MAAIIFNVLPLIPYLSVFISLGGPSYGGPSGVRTLDLGIKSPLLCQLS